MEREAELTLQSQALANNLKPVRTQMRVRLRDFNEADLPFVISSWFESARPSYSVKIPTDIYQVGMTARISRLADRSLIRIACDELQPSKIYGWVCYEPLKLSRSLVIHYIYTLFEARRRGVATALFEDIGGDRNRGTVITHANFRTKHMAKKLDLIVDTSLLGEGDGT